MHIIKAPWQWKRLSWLHSEYRKDGTKTRTFFAHMLPSTSLLGIHSETSIHHYNMPLTHSSLYDCFPHVHLALLAIQAGLLTPLTFFARHHLSPLMLLLPMCTFFTLEGGDSEFVNFTLPTLKAFFEARRHKVSGNKQ